MIIFLFFLICLCICCYFNIFQAGYVWDDRAAIANNKDITSLPSFQTILNIFQHDFWGQNITDKYSHKSYRPITTLSYYINYYLFNDMNPSYFHISNVLIYILSLLVYSQLLRRFISKKSYIISLLLFCLHPIHIEGVSSLVGRADSLCGVFYFTAIIFYSDSIGLSLQSTSSFQSYNQKNKISFNNQKYYSYFNQYCYLFIAYFFGILACFTKEIGLTVFGIFLVLEYLSFHLNWKINFNKIEQGYLSNHYHSYQWFYYKSQLVSLKSSTIFEYFQSLYLFFKSSFSLQSNLFIRLILSFSSLFLILYLRYLLHGDHQLYDWTIMENHISLESSFLTRCLSYGHTHYLYALKLFNPITPHLSFDYGYPCLPIIKSIFEPINIFTFLTYFTAIIFILYSLLKTRMTLIFSFILIIFPLLPALNILFPVGTLLAERLLFIPSSGVTLLIAELYTNEFQSFWCSDYNFSLVYEDEPNFTPNSNLKSNLSSSSSSSSSSTTTTTTTTFINNSFNLKRLRLYFILLFPLLPLFGIMAYRVRERNFDWIDERSLYESSLKVCPDNVRALNNVGMLRSNYEFSSNVIDLLERARELYPYQGSTYINSGISYGRSNKYIKAFYRLSQGLRLSRTESSRMLMGYLGLLHSQYFYYLHSETLSSDSAENLIIILLNGRYYLNLAIENYWNPPSAYLALATIEYELNTYKTNGYLLSSSFSTSSSYISLNYDNIENYILTAIELNNKLLQLSKQGIPVQDLIDTYSAYNQLGVYYLSKYEEILDQLNMNKNFENKINLERLLQYYFEKVESSFFECIKLEPLRYEARMNLGTFYQRQNKNEQSLKIFLETIDIFPNKESIPFLVWNNLGTIQEKLQKYSDAKISFKNALNILESKNAINHPNYKTLVMNLKRVQSIEVDKTI